MRIAVFAVVLALSHQATATEYRSVPDEKSGVSFKAHTSFHDFIGRSTQVTSHFLLENGEMRDAEVTVPVASIRTGNDRRDHDMVSEAYLDQAHHPDIVFVAREFDGEPVQPGRDGSGQLQGTLTVRGESKPVSIPVQYHWQGSTVVVSGELPIDIRDYGMKPPTLMLVQHMDAQVLMRFRLTFAPG
jgi:polyisoprenoid-binding protein YceI